MEYKQVQHALRQKQSYNQYPLKQDQYGSLNSARIFRLYDLKNRTPKNGYELKFYTPGPIDTKGITKNRICQGNTITSVLGNPKKMVLSEYYISSKGLNLIYLPRSAQLQTRAVEYCDEIHALCKDTEGRRYQQLIGHYEKRLYGEFQCRVVVSGKFQAWNDVTDNDADLVVSDAEKIWLLTITDDRKNTKGVFYYHDKRQPYRNAYYQG